MNKLVIIAILFTVSGCATMLDGSSQFLTVVPSNAKTNDTKCTAQNEEGNWKLIPSQSVSIHRDGNEMTVNCENAVQKGSVKVSPEFHGGYIFLDILTDFCTISCLIDGGTNSWYEYPPSIAVPMGNINGTASNDRTSDKVALEENPIIAQYKAAVAAYKIKSKPINDYIVAVCRLQDDKGYIECLNSVKEKALNISVFPELLQEMYDSRAEYENQLLRNEITRNEFKEAVTKLEELSGKKANIKIENDIQNGIYTGNRIYKN